MTLRLTVLTTGRQDWGMLRPLCEELSCDAYFNLRIWAGGMACDKHYSTVADEIQQQGLPLNHRMEWDLDAAPANQVSEAIVKISHALQDDRPDVILILGDRFETCAAALAAALERIPIIHLYGGEETEGAFDNVLRNAISKMSHLHFVANDHYRRRLIAMGEDPNTIHSVGLLSLDLVSKQILPERNVLEQDLGIKLEPPVCLVTLHPTTLETDPLSELSAVKDAMRESSATWIVTLPNSDPGGDTIRRFWEEIKQEIPNLYIFSALGEIRYFGLMRLASLVLGNSSSGLTEAPFFGVPTVNIGDRQKGRLRSRSVIDVPSRGSSISAAIQKALDPEFRRSFEGMVPAYGQGDAAQQIRTILRHWKAPLNCRKSSVFLDVT